MSLSKLVKYGIMAALLAGAVIAVRSYVGMKDHDWQIRVEEEMTRATLALDSARVDRARADSASARADELSLAVAARDVRIDAMRSALPEPTEDCEVFTAPRDSVIAEMDVRHEDVLAALDSERSATALLRAAEARAHASADSLFAVLKDRPRPLSPLIPSVGVGITAGICSTGQPCIAAGLTLSWEIRIF